MNVKNALIAATLASAVALTGSAFAAVKIDGKNTQSTTVQGAVLNAAVGAAATAKQNISSNKGKVSITGDNKQETNVKGAVLNASVGAASRAEQNVSSNEGN